MASGTRLEPAALAPPATPKRTLPRPINRIRTAARGRCVPLVRVLLMTSPSAVGSRGRGAEPLWSAADRQVPHHTFSVLPDKTTLGRRCPVDPDLTEWRRPTAT